MIQTLADTELFVTRQEIPIAFVLETRLETRSVSVSNLLLYKNFVNLVHVQKTPIVLLYKIENNAIATQDMLEILTTAAMNHQSQSANLIHAVLTLNVWFHLKVKACACVLKVLVVIQQVFLAATAMNVKLMTSVTTTELVLASNVKILVPVPVAIMRFVVLKNIIPFASAIVD